MKMRQFSNHALVVPTVVLLMGLAMPNPAGTPLTDKRTALREHAIATSKAVTEEAQRRGIPERMETLEGEPVWLSAFIDGRPVYTGPLAESSAVSINFHRLYDRYPEIAFDEQLIVGVWDSARVRPDHPELNGRIVNMEDSEVPISDHSTAIAGVIASSGVDPAARGMLPAAQIHAYDLKDDLIQMTERAFQLASPDESANLLVSNHSYGDFVGWGQARIELEPDVFWQGWLWFGDWPEREDRKFGQYNEKARDWDALLHAAPHFLPVRAGGNDRTEGLLNNGNQFRYWDETTETWTLKSFDAATDPFPDNWKDGGYDTIGTFATSKNLLTVGAVIYPISSNDRLAEAARMTAFSSWGPCDDGRIKPDVVASGEDVLVLWGTDPFFYASGSGTSFSAPAVSGLVIFLQGMHTQSVGEPMYSSVAKGLVIHTATDIGNPGPDYKNGWGLVDALAAANTLEKHLAGPEDGIVHVELLEQGGTFTHTFAWDGFSPIRATLCWTDPAGPIMTGMNDPTPVLVNDLDLRIAGPGGAEIYHPFVLDGANPSLAATTGDNVLDNVEQVLIPAPTVGEYTLTVTHKGALVDGPQRFALVLTGQELPGMNVGPKELQSARHIIGGAAPEFNWLISNPTLEPMQWEIESAPDWLLFDAASGSIPAGESTLVTATFTPPVPEIEPDYHLDQVAFVETGSSRRRTREVAVDIWRAITPGFADDFETGALADTWRTTGIGQPRATVRSNLAPIDSWHLVMDDYMLGSARSRIEVTTLLQTAGWSDLQITFDAKSFHNPSLGPHANPYLGGSSTTGVALSADGHLWHEVFALRGSNITLGYTPRGFDLGAAVATTGLTGQDHVYLRFSTFVRNPADIASNMSGIALDNITITGIPTAFDLWAIY